MDKEAAFKIFYFVVSIQKDPHISSHLLDY